MVYPSWSPDGRYILGTTTGTYTLRVFDLEKNHWTTFEKAVSAVVPTWSHDGHFVYYVDPSHDPVRVSRLAISDAKIERVADLNYFHPTGFNRIWLGLDPQDAPLLLRDIGSHKIYALTLERK